MLPRVVTLDRGTHSVEIARRPVAVAVGVLIFAGRESTRAIATDPHEGEDLRHTRFGPDSTCSFRSGCQGKPFNLVDKIGAMTGKMKGDVNPADL